MPDRLFKEVFHFLLQHFREALYWAFGFQKRLYEQAFSDIHPDLLEWPDKSLGPVNTDRSHRNIHPVLSVELISDKRGSPSEFLHIK